MMRKVGSGVAKRHALADGMGSSRRNSEKQDLAVRRACGCVVEQLEKRTLLSGVVSELKPSAMLSDQGGGEQGQYGQATMAQSAPLEVVNIPDANLEAAVRAALSMPTGEITSEDMAGLTSLAARFCGIHDLTGLEYATNLEQLDLRDNHISDLTPLERLTHLREINVSYNDLRVTPGSYSLCLIQRWIDLSANVTYLPQNVNQRPIDITISANRVAADQPVGTRVGAFSTTDPDGDEDFTYTLVAGAGDGDNPLFSIDGDTLRTADLLHFRFGMDHYSIRVRTMDQGGLTFEKVFSIRMADPVSLAGQWGGSVLQVVTRGTMAYMCQGQSLVVMDISEPSSPRDVGRVIIPEVAVDGSCGTESLTVADNYAYVAVGDKGLVVIDISTPTAPRLVRKYDTAGFVADVSVVGRFAYLAEDVGLEIIDITKPLVPGSVSWLASIGIISRVAVAGNYAYVGGGPGGFQVIDISKPTSPVRVGGTTGTGELSMTGLTIAGNYAYVAHMYHLAIIDISQPANLSLVADYATVDWICDVKVAGHYAYAADSYYGLEVIDVSNSAAPTFAGKYDTPGYAWGLSVAGSYAYVADYNSGLQVIDVSTASSPTLAGEFQTDAMADRVQVVGNYAYVADGNNGLMVMDVSTASFPKLLGTYKTPGQARDLSIVGNYAYIAESYSGLEVVDISDPAAPVLVGRYATPGEACGVSVVGDYAYVVGERSMVVLDVSTPSAPEFVGQWMGSDNMRSVSVVGRYAYVVDFRNGLEIVDISVPSDPQLVGMESDPAYFNEGVSVAGNYAYVAADSDGLDVIDISVPSAPVRVCQYSYPALFTNVTVAGSYLYATVIRDYNQGGGLLVFDISTPSAPVLVGSQCTAGYSYDVSLAGHYAYVADNWNGLCIVDLENQVPTDITLLGTTVAADSPAGTAVGSVYAFDPDFSEAFTYSLVDGAGSDDNALFSINGSTLQTAQAVGSASCLQMPASFAPNASGTYSIRVRTTDQGGLWYEKVLTVSVTDANEAPTDIALSSTSVSEGLPAGTDVGTFAASDPDVRDTFTYTLVGGVGGADNASFAISGNQLLTAASFDYEAKSSYSIRVRTTDQGGLWFEKVFTISVTDVDEVAPTVTAVYVRGSSWNTNFLSFLAANMSGSSSTYGYAIPVGSGATQLQTLPWRNLNRISIAFSEDVSVSQAQFAIVGSVGSYSVSGFSYSATDHVATWSLSAAIGADRLYVALPGDGATPVTDTAGNALDGEWTNPASYSQVGATSVFPSGNGAAGGDFAFRVDVLPGDSTGGSLGKVNVADINQTKSRSSLPETTSSYRSDFDGNDLVNVADITYVKTRSAVSSLPVNPPVLPTFGSAFSQVSLLLRRRVGVAKLGSLKVAGVRPTIWEVV